MSRSVNRRQALKAAAAGGLALGLTAASYERVLGANQTLTVGVMGTGGRGTALAGSYAKLQGTEVTFVCDVDQNHCRQAANKVGKDCTQYHDFREVLDRKDINAVTIGTPDHWHTLVALDAMRKGKDVYCEKPLTLTVAEGQSLVKVCRQTDRVFQVGSQQRSDQRFRLACELVRNGRIGKVKVVQTRIGDNPRGGPFPTAPVPEGLDHHHHHHGRDHGRGSGRGSGRGRL